MASKTMAMRPKILVWTETYRLGGSDRFLLDFLRGVATTTDVVLASNRHPALEAWLADRHCPLSARVTLPVANLVASPVARLRARVMVPGPPPLADEAPEPVASAAAAATALLRYRAALVNYERLRRLLQRIQPDAVLINNGGYPGAETCRVLSIAARRSGVPRIVHFVHNVAYPRSWPVAMERRYDEMVDRAVTAWVTAAHTVSDVLAERRGLTRDRMHTVHYGIPDGTVTLGESERDVLRRDLGFGHGDLGVAVVAGFERRKGHDVLVRALARTPPDVRVALLGRGEEEAAVRSLVASLGLEGRVHFAGWRDDVPRVLAAADALVLPSLGNECLPYAILEAMQQRLPVIATRVAGIPEAVDDGVTGTVVPPGDAGALAVAMTQLASDRALVKAQGEAGADRQRRLFATTAMVAGVAALLERP